MGGGVSEDFRPYRSWSTEEIEQHLWALTKDPAELELAQYELSLRTTNAAKILERKLQRMRDELSRQAKSASSIAPETRRLMSGTLEKLREKLIDISKRNPLIAFKHSERGATFIRVVDELPDVLFQRLGSGAMAFDPLPNPEEEPADQKTPAFQLAVETARLTDEVYLAGLAELGAGSKDEEAVQKLEQELVARVRERLGLPRLSGGKKLDIDAFARANGFDPSFELAAEAGPGAHLSDASIRVLYTRDRLDARLRTIYDRYRGHAAELGIHTLQIAFGFIEWREPEGEKQSHQAPLLLMPVHLRRQIRAGRYVYELSGEDENLSVNMALQEMLKRNFGVVLPAVAEQDTPESYFVRVQTLLAEAKRDLRVLRFVTIAVLPFPNMAVWRDLDPEHWPSGEILAHPHLQRLLGATGGASGASAFPADYDVESMPTGEAPPLVLPADVSQHSALVDVCARKSLAVEGPPGTGKSQTIANMIAAALHESRRVLFVAEKRAALEVVARRLEALGFGPLMLELHSERSTKSQVIESLRHRLKCTPRAPRNLAQAVKDHGERRDLLKLYRSLLQQTTGALGRTVNALVWREMSLRQAITADVPRSLWTATVTGADQIDELDLLRRREALDAVEATAQAITSSFGAFTGSRWHAVHSAPAQPIGQDEVRQRLASLLNGLPALQGAAKEFAERSGSIGPDTPESLRAWAEAAARLPSGEGVKEAVFSAGLREPVLVRILLEMLCEWRASAERVAPLHPVPLEADLSLVRDAEGAFANALVTVSSLAEARQALDEAVGTLARLRELSTFADRVFKRFCPSSEATAPKLIGLGEAILQLDELDDAALGLRSEALLGEGACARLREAARQAEELMAQEARLASFGDVGRLASTAAGDLDATAAVLTSTSFLARPFSSSYRAALARAKGYCLSHKAKPAELARGLMEAATFVRSRDAFRQEVRFASLFPQERWEGHHSDFAAAQRAAEAFARIATRLAILGLEDALGGLAVEPTRTLRSAAAQTRSSEECLKAFGELGGTERLEHATDGLESKIEAHRSAVHAAQSATIPENVAIRRTEALSVILEQHQSLAARLAEAEALHPWFRGVDADEAEIATHLTLAEEVLALGLPAELFEALRGAERPAQLMSAFCACGTGAIETLTAFVREWSEFRDNYDVQTEAFLGGEIAGLGFDHVFAALQAARSDETGLQLFADLSRYRRAAEQLGLGGFIKAAERASVLHRLADAFELALIRTLLQQLFRADGALLERLGGTQLGDASRRFVELDKLLEELEAARIIAERLDVSAPIGNGSGARTTWTDLCLIENECSKIKRHVPIRDLVSRAYGALQALKPVWLMSPTSVAQFVPPGTAEFDLIVVDEASQMTPEMAVGALARAAQVVIVGDPKQLPPTNFFKNRADAVDDDDEDDGLDVESESILDLAFSRLDHRRRLKWHYRSQHASLIQFSNRQFYDNELVIFPSPVTSDEFLGVKSRFVGGTYEGRVNVKEAEAVIEALVGLIYARPELTYGVVTMNMQQRELIFQEFERIKAQDRVVAAYAEAREGTVDELFIKNLENVQGDERDIMLVSTVYGPPPGGGRVLQRFGLFTRKDGHRRLNVLVTRARMATLLYTSLRPTDVVITETSSHGVRALREYLAYAEGAAFVDHEEGAPPDSDFEEFVADRVRAHGYEVVPQVGVEGFRIDLGIKHPAYAAGFLAGVECDGAAYHSGLAVRDRDRIRQEVLERLGWRIYRIWSTDWFNDPERETAKLIAWLDRLREKAEAALASREPAASAPNRPAVRVQEEVPATPRSSDKTPAVPAQLTLLPVAADPEPAANPNGPSGKRHVVDGIEFYEEMPGYFEVWIDGAARGSVERLSTAMRSAHVYGSTFKAEKPQFRVTRYWDETTFNSDDIYAAVRRLASNFREQLAEV